MFSFYLFIFLLFYYYYYFHYYYYFIIYFIIIIVIIIIIINTTFINFIYLFIYLFLFIYFFWLHILFYLTYASKVRAACVVLPYNDGSKAPIRLSGRGRFCLVVARSGMFGLGIAPKEKLSRLFNPVSIGIRLVPGNVFMVAIDMYGKSALWEWIYGIT